MVNFHSHTQTLKCCESVKMDCEFSPETSERDLKADDAP